MLCSVLCFNYSFAQDPECRNRLTSGGACHKLFLPSQNLGHNSFNSSSTWSSTTSVADVLQVYSENPEETLYELGFGCEDPQVTVRIPPRFLNFPSQAKGMTFRLFLDAQLRRIREEDPSLSLASRFRQVQVLTAMANAFYSLYSHVSRTPVQKLSTPEFNFSTPIERMERFRSSIRSDPRSPVDKLKDTVSKMCLYTGSNRESDSPLPSPSNNVGFPEIVDIVLEKPRHVKKLNIGQGDLNAVMDVCTDDQGYFNINTTEHLTSAAGEEANQTGNTNNELAHNEEADIIQTEECNNETCRTYISSLLPEPESSVCAGGPKPLVKASFEHICPQIVECVHQAPFDFQYEHSKTGDVESAGTEIVRDTLCLKSLQAKRPVSSSSESTGPAVNQDDTSQPRPSSVVNSTQICCCITVKTKGDSIIVPPTKMCKKTEHDTHNQCLSPEPLISRNLQQVNSFELEEMHSAGEEDLGQSETSKAVPPKSCFRGEIIREDSMQSDSSGYADDVPSGHHS
uniref:ITPR-interacting domain-containing protein n=1 Tax=Neogobius melanostomus TaxID=47308 RepID=A0A8C6T7F3_9GOBI